MSTAAQTLLTVLKSQLQGNETPEERERLTVAVAASVGLPDDVVQEVLRMLVPAPALMNGAAADPLPGPTEPSAEEASCPSSMAEAGIAAAAGDDDEPAELPRLLIDWGQDLQVGWQACAECHLVCPPPLHGRPRVHVVWDARLDHPRESETPMLSREQDGLWSFPLAFGLTTDGQDCRPGQYLLRFSVVFPQVVPPSPRLFQCRIRLNVLEPGAAGGRTLEIDGDGGALLNLQGRDLSSFAKVVLRGSGNAVVNVQESLLGGGSPPDVQPVADPPRGEPLQFDYPLRVDAAQADIVPFVSTGHAERRHLDTLSLIGPDGLQILLLARRKVRLGRARTCDIVTRFLPRSEAHDRLSRNLSREHVSCQLTDDGLMLTDLGSSKGTTVNGVALCEPQLLTARDAGEAIPVQLATQVSASTPFRCEIQIFSRREQRENDQDLLCWDALGIDPAPLWRLAEVAGIDAARIRRLNNLAHEEQYLLLYRQAMIGCSPEAAIRTPEGAAMQARLLHMDGVFWLEQLTSESSTQVNGRPVQPFELIPLAPGTQLTFTGSDYQVAEFGQRYLGRDV